MELASSSRVKSVAPVRERGLKYFLTPPLSQKVYVAPVRERGLKFNKGGEENEIV